VGLRWALAAFVAGILVLWAGASLPAAGQGSEAEIPVKLLFDFGDGSYVWASPTIRWVNETNTTWDLIEQTAGALGIPIESAWFPDFGVAILDVGDRNPPAGFVGLFLWNRTAHAWELTDEGVSTLVLQDGDALALSNAAFDSVTYETRRPVPTPDDRFPSTTFRGDASNRGVASSSPDRIRILWDRDTGAVEIGATPAVAYGRVYVNTIEGFMALDEATGEVLWRTLEARGFSSPAVFDESVFVGSSNGTVYRMDAADGRVEWSTRLLEETGFSGITSSPKIVFDSVYIGTFNELGGPGEVVSLWASNGSVRWRTETGSVHFSSPAVANGTVYVGVAGRYNTTSQITFEPPFGLLALDASTGEEQWFFETSGSVSASPVVAGSAIVLAAKDGSVYAIDRISGDELWSRDVQAGVSSPAVEGDWVFVGGGSFGGQGRVTALGLSTGDVRWTFTPNGPVQSSITHSTGKILFSTNTATGSVYALEATTRDLVWRFTPSPAQYILSSPVVANGIVFAASDNGHVYALGQGPEVGVGEVDSLGFLGLLGLVSAGIAVAAIVLFVLFRRPRRGP
jgi:outer membrane protein assembly factor BamB